MISNHDKYYNKYLRYKQKYEELSAKNLDIESKVVNDLITNMNGGMMSWLWGSTPKTSLKPEKELYDYLLKNSYFNLFFYDIPNKLSKLGKEIQNQPDKTIETQLGGARSEEKSQSVRSNKVPNAYALLTDEEMKKSSKKLILWKISNIIYSELFSDKQYPELNYNNRMTNLKSYIIVVLIRKIFQTEAKSTTTKDYNIEKLIDIFKCIGLYIYMKLYQLLHYHGNVQFKYISNNYASKSSSESVQQLINNIKKIIDLFSNRFSNKDDDIVDRLLKLYEINLRKQDNDNYSIGELDTQNLDQAALYSLEMIQKSKVFQQIISMEDTYFFNAFIELTVTQSLYDKCTSVNKC
jgi:hypothetical protein